MILLIDNYDSFVHNLARYFRRLGQATVVYRNDAVSIKQVEALAPDAIVLSPGPCTPTEAGISTELVRSFCDRLPILGVCLGHQVIAEALGGAIVRADEPVHGRCSRITHDGSTLFDGVPKQFDAARYHSLVVERSTLPETLHVSARTDDGSIMAIEHRASPVCGLQFHPESILTNVGFRILANFMRLANVESDASEDMFASERQSVPPRPRAMPTRPVAFQEVDPL
ncbi:MAG: aminodeoxychorismate/anthranilate synthase component II [Pirellulales bacterium]|nr:aminodeoxychorismate/anthranilate synthase component II [Pirellulales bacterium]